MRLGISTCFRDRRLSRAVRRIRPLLGSLEREFASQELEDPIHAALLIGLTDVRGGSWVEEAPNSDGFFHMLVGLGPSEELLAMADHDLAAIVFAKVSAAVAVCPFSVPDRRKMEQVLSRWAATHLPPSVQQRHSS